MTKAEVQKKLQETENRLARRQQDLKNLNRKLDSLNNTARQLDREINDLAGSRKKLEETKAEARQLYTKVDKLKSDFEARQARRVSAYNRNSAQPFTTRFISAYLSGMKELLSGSEYRKTLNGLENAVEKVKKKLRETETDIDTVNKKVNDRRKRIDSNTRDVRNCRNSIAATSREIEMLRKECQRLKAVLMVLS